MSGDNWPTRRYVVAGLHLDSKNPRLGRETLSRAPREIIQYLFEHDDALEVADSIANRGFFPNEPLLAVKEGARLVVVEGNRRLAALKALREPGLLDGGPRRQVERLSRRIPDVQTIATVPVTIAPNRRATDRQIAGRHIGTPVRAWQAENRASFILDKLEEGYDNNDLRDEFYGMPRPELLESALEYPWEKWTTFLHPDQRGLVQRQFGGAARVSGSAGTGKTIVALHRAAYLARTNPDARVLLTTFSETLASWLQLKLAQLISTEPRVRERIEVDPLDAVARRLYERTFGKPMIASAEVIQAVVREAAEGNPENKFSLQFLVTEWNEIVDAWQLASWDEYRDVARLGRKTRLPEKQRRVLWEIFERARGLLKSRGMITPADMYSRLTAHFASGAGSPYDFIVVDEAQDVSVPQLRFVAALGQGRPESLFFAGDLGQRIFQLPFSWKSLGVDIRGRSGTLRVNYRTSHQIRTQADRLLGPIMGDVDGNIEQRSGTISLFNGPQPTIQKLETVADEVKAVGQWLADRAAEGVKPEEIGVFVRSPAELPRAHAAVEAAGLPFTVLGEHVKPSRDLVSIGTMHLSKGLEFRSVVVMACDDEVLPLQSRIETVADDSDLEEVYETERHLLYVACTRARDHLLVSGVKPVSEFLDDLGG